MWCLGIPQPGDRLDSLDTYSFFRADSALLKPSPTGLRLGQGVEAYRFFDEKRDGCTKVVLTP